MEGNSALFGVFITLMVLICVLSFLALVEGIINRRRRRYLDLYRLKGRSLRNKNKPSK